MQCLKCMFAQAFSSVSWLELQQSQWLENYRGNTKTTASSPESFAHWKSSVCKWTVSYIVQCYYYVISDNSCYYMVVAANGPNAEILQFDWFISRRIYPELPVQVVNLKWPCLLLKFLTKYEVKVYYKQLEMKKEPWRGKFVKKFFTKWRENCKYLFDVKYLCICQLYFSKTI